MKRTLKKGLTGTALLLLLGAWGNAADCRLGFMHDPCARDGYSIVETEPVVKGHHNWMEVAHHYPWEVRTTRYHRSYRGKNTVRARSAVASVGS
jgi:hypothetical protein